MGKIANHWLLKSEPDVYGWDDLVAAGEGVWDGVRNYTARNNLRAMAVGDTAFFYHSNIGLAVVGVMRIVEAAFPDPTVEGDRWSAVRVAPVRALARPVTLAEIKANPALAAMDLVTKFRLSVSHVRPDEWNEILAMAKR